MKDFYRPNWHYARESQYLVNEVNGEIQAIVEPHSLNEMARDSADKPHSVYFLVPHLLQETGELFDSGYRRAFATRLHAVAFVNTVLGVTP